MGDHWGTGRMEAFSDGVFAIAITLLVLEISVPESAYEDLWSGIAHQWPSYLALLVISLLLSALWGSVALDPHVLRPDVSDDEIRAIALATTPSIGLYVVMIVLAVFAPRVAIFGYLAVGIIALFRMRGDSIPARAPTST